MSISNTIKLSATALLVLAFSSSFYLLNQHESVATEQKTNDAYVQADLTTISAQIYGVVDEVRVVENQRVREGDLLLYIDKTNYEIALERAKSMVESSKVNIEILTLELKQQESVIKRAKSSINAVKARIELANRELTRYKNLAENGSGSRQAFEQAKAQLVVEKESLVKEQTSLTIAIQQVGVLNSKIQKASADLDTAYAEVASAKTHLSYTEVRSPINGIIGVKVIREGEYTTAGKPLFTIVPDQSIYILANYRETQLANVSKGQRVSFKVDALPEIDFTGKVESIGPASSLSYSSISSHNASGNFTKIVQRLPIRIAIDKSDENISKLKVGMSVVPIIHVRKS